jgi:hypothetical protein
LRTHYPEKKKDDDEDDEDLTRRNDNDVEEEEDDEDSKMMDIVSSVAIMPSKLKQPPNISITISSSDKRNLTVRVRSFNHFDVETEHSRLRRVMSSDSSNAATAGSDDEDVFGSPPHSPSQETRSRSGSVDGMWVVDSKIEDLCTYDMLHKDDDLHCLESSRILTLCSEFLQSGTR